MAYYIHRERYVADVVPPKSIIKFPTLVNESLNRAAFRNIPPYNNMDEEEWQATIVNDIYYHGCTLSPLVTTDVGCDEFYSTLFEGAFDINLPGIYILAWYVSGMTGIAPDGRFFQLKYYNYETQRWETPSAGSRLLVSASEFCTVINLTNDCFPEPNGGKMTVALFNESDEAMFMNRTPQLKAGFALFGFSPVTEEQLAEVEKYIAELMGDCCGMGDKAYALACLKWQLTKLEATERNQDDLLDQLELDWEEFYQRFERHTAGTGVAANVPTIFGSETGTLIQGLRVFYLRVGYIFHIWLSGTLDVTRANPIGRVYITPAIHNNIPLLPFLQFYNRPVANVGTLIVIRNKTVANPTVTRYPVYIDKSGIYFNLTTATTFSPPRPAPSTEIDPDFFSFSMTLVLEEIVD